MQNRLSQATITTLRHELKVKEDMVKKLQTENSAFCKELNKVRLSTNDLKQFCRKGDLVKDSNALRRNHDHHYKEFLRNKSDINWVHYKQSRNKCNMAVRNAKRNFLIRGLQKPTNTLWKHLKACLGSSTSRRVQLPWPAITGKEAAAAAQIINEFFVISGKISSATNRSADLTLDVSPCNSSLSFVPVTAKDIAVALTSMASTTSSGTDNITLQQLRLSSPEILPVLANIFNLSLRTRKFPLRWKHSLVTSVHRKGDIYDVRNYRPISLLLTCQSCWRNVHDYLSSNQLISANQHGFIKGRSCETALINLSSSLFSSRDEGLYSAVAALDFTKAFDTACHDILLAQLPHFGFNSTVCNFFNSYLSDRVQSVRYAGYTSEPLQVTSGVPESIVIGPLLFVIYITDLLTSLPANTVMAYADDVTLVAYGQSEAKAAGALQVLLN